MLTEKPILIDSIKAEADVLRFRFMGFDGNYPTADTKSLGVINADTKGGQMAPVTVLGIAVVEASAAIAKGGAVAAAANGKAKAVSAAEVVVGYAMDAATVDGDLIRLRLE